MSEWPKPVEPPTVAHELAQAVGGTINEAALLPDGSGFFTMSMPLPKDHWIYGKDDKVHPVHGFTVNPPPMPFRMGVDEHVNVLVFPNTGWPDRSHHLTRKEFAEIIRKAGKYAVRSSTMNGKEMDFDPDAMLQNLIVAFLGYWTADGLSSDEWDNPGEIS